MFCQGKKNTSESHFADLPPGQTRETARRMETIIPGCLSSAVQAGWQVREPSWWNTITKGNTFCGLSATVKFAKFLTYPDPSQFHIQGNKKGMCAPKYYTFVDWIKYVCLIDCRQRRRHWQTIQELLGIQTLETYFVSTSITLCMQPHSFVIALIAKLGLGQLPLQFRK